MESNPSDRVPPILRTSERKPGAENAGQTHSRNSRENLADRKEKLKFIFAELFLDSRTCFFYKTKIAKLVL